MSTDAMLALGARLAALAHALEELATRVAQAPRATGAGLLLVPADAWAGTAGALDDRAEELAGGLRRTGAAAGELRARLQRAAADYARAEDAASWLAQAQGALIAAQVGAAWPLLLSAAVNLGVSGWLGWHLAPGTDAQKKRAIGRLLLAHPELVTSPAFVAVVRGFASSIDDALLGAAGVPWPFAWVLGSSGSGAGVEVGGTAVLAGGAVLGLFQESDVRVRRVGERAVAAPPATLVQRLARVPSDSRGPDPQVYIERYSAPGSTTRWVVYIDPTETFSPAATGEPWDLTSNVDGVAGRTAGSYRATEQAMRDAGVAAGDPVQFVGFSQGGLVAGMLAASGGWSSAGLDTFGAPIGNLPLPDGLPGMNVRHTDDLVPALAGADRPSERMLIEQRAFPDGIPAGEPAPAHQRDSYERTAAQIDAASSPEVRAQLETMRRFTADQAALPGATITGFTYQATRVGPDRPAWLEPGAPRVVGDRVR
ncbi:MAG: hypothetical protein HY996_12135 [Micrococcales bacterium]|nr:hypothetical protein [Micrococcales bacterium]